MEKRLVAGIFVLLSLVAGGTYWIADTDQANLYQCEDIVGLCFKLSKVNADGIQTRCYYNESSPRKYKNCPIGWIKVEFTEVTGEETELPDYTMDISTKTFSTKQEAIDYIGEQRRGLSYTTKILRKEQDPYSELIEIHYRFTLRRDGEVIEDFTNIGTIPERVFDYFDDRANVTVYRDVSEQEILDKINIRAEQLMNNWKPNVKVIHDV